MATSVAEGLHARSPSTNEKEDPFTETGQTPNRPAHIHRYSSRFDLDHSPFGATNSPTQVKKALEAHLVDTEQRLQDAKTLGESLLAQQSKLQEKLREVESQQAEAEITPELKEQLKAIGQEHDDVSREIARSLLAPRSRVVSGEEQQGGESSVYTSQASGSPTKISAPSRRQRNQPTSRTADVQFAADISVSLLAQVRALQAAVAERDEMLKGANSDRLKLESNVQTLMQRMRTQDENEQRYKDENWNLETQNHELLAVAKEAGDKEKKLGANLALILAEKTRLLNELEETRSAHDKLSEEHSAARKAHETELHSLKKDVDSADTERASLHERIEELTSQNHELARAISGKYRNITPNQPGDIEGEPTSTDKDAGTPEHSPPPSPTKGTPRHGGLESETLRSSLHHAHRQIQNLKSNIHREKTEKIELKRMLQDARDELEQSRSGANGASKRQKLRSDGFKKPARPDMLGGSRRTQTDVEVDEEEWEDQLATVPGEFPRPAAVRGSSFANTTDASDAYQTATETENDFETADERNTTTESEAFETGAESLAGDSSEELTETEDNVPRPGPPGTNRYSRPGRGSRNAGNRSSFYSTASTSADEDDTAIQTPVQPQPSRFRLRNGRSSYVRQSQLMSDNTPDSVRTVSTSQDSPATITAGMSPPPNNQSLFAELGGADEAGSSTYNTPARSSIASGNTPGSSYTPSKPSLAEAAPIIESRPVMVDSGMMTDEWQPQPAPTPAPVVPKATASLSGILAANSIEPVFHPRATSPSDFPLPPSVPASPVRHADTSTQYTPQRFVQESPLKNTAFITPPKTSWDEAHEAESPHREQSSPASDIPAVPFTYSNMLTQQTLPVSPPIKLPPAPPIMAFSTISSQNTVPIIEKPSKVEDRLLAGAELPEDERLPSDSTEKAAAGVAGGFLAGAAAALGFGSKEKNQPATVIAEDETHGFTAAPQDDKDKSLQEVAVNAASKSSSATTKSDELRQGIPIRYSSNDQSAQTTLTAEQIEQALQLKRSGPLSPVVAPAPRSPALARTRSPPPLMTLPESDSPYASLPPVPAMSPNRPSSASSQRASVTNAQSHPPLPQDYRTTIARASSLASQQPNVSARDATQSTSGTTIMGPPLMPASAMRRPNTPGESIRSVVRDAPPSRASQSSRVDKVTRHSQVSRRSSVSSFASELDDRFNIRTDGQPVAGQQYHGPVTDPRMIQAITQTMIGEYLWKYTRRAGSKEFSNSRHRRYFWVHPYNKTLHWSDHDPQTAGSREAKSKGVVIESVRVVTDDNPMPPGLHRKSLEISTPGRKIKITASTGQRHETWFNALSYLLLRGDPADAVGAYATGGPEVTREDIEEFNVGYNPRLTRSASRLSMSSYNSRTTSNTAYRSSRQAMPANVVVTNPSGRPAELQPSAIESQPVSPVPDSGRSSRTDQFADSDLNRTIRAKSMSRISKMFGSVTKRTSHSSLQPVAAPQTRGHGRHESENSIYNASIVSGSRRDSAEELRQEMLREEEGGLENVRACCDGKHDVSTLVHGGHGAHRHGRASGTFQSMTDRVNRSMSRRV